MLQSNQAKKPVKAVLRVSMIVDGEACEKGDVVELAHREFVYLANHDRVAEATSENVAAVRAEVKSEKEAAERAAKPAETDLLRARIAQLEAELAKKK